MLNKDTGAVDGAALACGSSSRRPSSCSRTSRRRRCHRPLWVLRSGTTVKSPEKRLIARGPSLVGKGARRHTGRRRWATQLASRSPKGSWGPLAGTPFPRRVPLRRALPTLFSLSTPKPTTAPLIKVLSRCLPFHLRNCLAYPQEDAIPPLAAAARASRRRRCDRNTYARKRARSAAMAPSIQLPADVEDTTVARMPPSWASTTIVRRVVTTPACCHVGKCHPPDMAHPSCGRPHNRSPIIFRLFCRVVDSRGGRQGAAGLGRAPLRGHHRPGGVDGLPAEFDAPPRKRPGRHGRVSRVTDDGREACRPGGHAGQVTKRGGHSGKGGGNVH